MPGILERVKNVARRFRLSRPPSGADAATGDNPYADLLARIEKLELAGRYEEIVPLCESAIDGAEPA